jgi:lipopolysaccharide export system protein LptA
MRAALLAVAFVVVLRGAAAAQDFAAAFADFDTGSGDAIQIEADKLEVNDEQKVAIYSGHVRVRQGKTLMETPELRVFYDGQAVPNGKAGSSVTRIEAGPGVSVRSGDQTATGDRATFEMAKDLVTLEGNVLLTQGTNVVSGDRVIVNLATKQGRVEGGRVQTLITPAGEGGQ